MNESSYPDKTELTNVKWQYIIEKKFVRLYKHYVSETYFNEHVIPINVSSKTRNSIIQAFDRYLDTKEKHLESQKAINMLNMTPNINGIGDLSMNVRASSEATSITAPAGLVDGDGVVPDVSEAIDMHGKTMSERMVDESTVINMSAIKKGEEKEKEKEKEREREKSEIMSTSNTIGKEVIEKKDKKKNDKNDKNEKEKKEKTERKDTKDRKHKKEKKSTKDKKDKKDKKEKKKRKSNGFKLRPIGKARGRHEGENSGDLSDVGTMSRTVSTATVVSVASGVESQTNTNTNTGTNTGTNTNTNTNTNININDDDDVVEDEHVISANYGDFN